MTLLSIPQAYLIKAFLVTSPMVECPRVAVRQYSPSVRGKHASVQTQGVAPYLPHSHLDKPTLLHVQWWNAPW